jgi:prepilin-type N-terminal cleavage/methylation domain-containing protein
MCDMNGTTRTRERNPCAGFTLIELVLATLISSLVIAIVSVSLSFSLRVWEKNQNQQSDDVPSLLELLKWQLASFDPVRIDLDGERQLIFQGDEHTLTFATDRSVRAISRGVPVIARYVYAPQEKKLYYAEMVLDPYHPDPIREFMQLRPKDDKSQPRFYPTYISSFAFAFGQKEDKGGTTESWDEATDIPQSVVVNWSSDGGASVSTQLIIPNFFFARKVQEKQGILNTSNPLDQ